MHYRNEQLTQLIRLEQQSVQVELRILEQHNLVLTLREHPEEMNWQRLVLIHMIDGLKSLRQQIQEIRGYLVFIERILTP